MNIQDMTWEVWQDIHQEFGPGDWDINTDTLSWDIPDATWTWMLVRHPQLIGKKYENDQ